jgi:hypothetical protein
MERVSTVFFPGPVHRDDVLRGSVILKGVRRREDETTAGPELLHPQFDLVADLFHSPEGHDPLNVDGSVKRELVTEFALDLFHVHISGSGLQWIENIQTAVDEVGNQ